jgi:hypothetical protein
MMSCPNSKTSVFTVAFFDILSLNLSLVGVCREVRQTGIQARHPCDDVVPLGYAHVFGTPPVSPALLYLLMQANIYSNSGKREVHFRIAEIEKCRDVFRNLKTTPENGKLPEKQALETECPSQNVCQRPWSTC